MRWLAAVLCLPVVLGAQTDYRQQFERWLTAEAMHHWEARDREIAALHTREAIAARQVKIRETALELIGGLPSRKTPLEARVTGSLVREGYRVENVIFESQPGFKVTANLYLPTTGRGPYPAVLGVAGHSTNGKASATYQRAFLGFVRRGIAVLAYDPPGQGERLEYFDAATGTSRVGIGVGEHQMAGVAALLTGQSIARHFIWDGIRAVDYLLTRPEIDPARIAVAGNSGGGTQAAYLALFEPRLANVISSCYMTRWRELWAGPGPQDAEQVWPGFVSRGLDFGDFALALAPRPFLITSAIRDYFPIAGARSMYRETLRLFDQLGGGAKLGFFEYDDTHGWSRPRREAASRWLEKFFLGRDSDGAEGEFETEEESLLYATPGGQLALAGGSRTMLDLARERLRELVLARRPVSLDGVREAVGWVEPAAAPRSFAGPEGIELEVEGGVRVPVEEVIPAGARRVVVYVGGGAGKEDADQNELVRGRVGVLRLSPRGSGPGYSQAGSSGYDLDYQLAARAWLLGRNLLQMQAADLVSAVRYLRQAHPGLRVGVFAKGRFGPAAVLAAALEPAIEKVLLEGSISSWASIVNEPLHQGIVNTVVPGILVKLDLADLKAQIAPRPIFELSPRTPFGEVERMPKSRFKNHLRGEGWSL